MTNAWLRRLTRPSTRPPRSAVAQGCRGCLGRSNAEHRTGFEALDIGGDCQRVEGALAWIHAQAPAPGLGVPLLKSCELSRQQQCQERT
jgi:hypothetical protein